MHEYSLASSLLRIVLEEAGKHEKAGRPLRVTAVELEIGLLTCLEANTLKGCFELLAEGTAAENSALAVRTRPMSGYCPDCAQQVSNPGRGIPGADGGDLRGGRAPDGCRIRPFSCPLCAGAAVAWEGGQEMKITAITVQAEQFNCEEEKRP
jgi:hydrogenase nickel incorporation protein HypA/HybF